MKIGFFSSLTAWLAGASLALAQVPTQPAPVGPGTVPGQVVPTLPGPVVTDGGLPYVGPEGVAYGLDDGAASGPGRFVDPGPAPGPRWFVSGEYILWRISNAPLPFVPLQSFVPLILPPVTLTNPTTGQIIQQNAFVLGVSQTFITFSNESIFPTGEVFDLRSINGMRFNGGLFFDPCGDFGVDAGYLQLDRHTVDSTVFVNEGRTVQLAFPITVPVTTIDPTTGIITTQLQNVNNQLNLTGNFITQAAARHSSRFWGAEMNARARVCMLFADRMDVFAGFRYLNLDEELDLFNSLEIRTTGALDATVYGVQTFANGTQAIVPSTQTGIPFPTSILTRSSDRITTENHFYGAQVGFEGEWHWGRLLAKARGAVAVGPMHQEATIEGNLEAATVQNGVTTTQRFASGILSNPADIGRHRRDRIGLVAEGIFNVGLLITPCLRGYVGYEFMHIQKVLRPGDQTNASSASSTYTVLQNNIAVSQVQNGFNFKESDIWVQGITLGLEVRY
jgi:hypothetical protein